MRESARLAAEVGALEFQGSAARAHGPLQAGVEAGRARCLDVHVDRANRLAVVAVSKTIVFGTATTALAEAKKTRIDGPNTPTRAHAVAR